MVFRPNILNFVNHFCSNLPKFDKEGFLSMGYNLSENVVGVLSAKITREKLFFFSHFSKI